MNVKTRQRLIVRVSGTTDMMRPRWAAVLSFELELSQRRLGDFRDAPARRGIAPVSVAQHFLGGEPVFQVATFRPAVFDPDQIGGMLDL